MSKPLLILSVTLVALFGAACGDDGDQTTAGTTNVPGVTATSVPGGSPQAGACPEAQQVCRFAAEVNRAVQSSDFSAVVSSAQGSEYACPATRPQGLGGPYPLCDGAPGGERRTGFEVAYLSSEGVVVNEQGLRQALNEWVRAATPAASDSYGSGASRLYTAGCPSGSNDCRDRFALVFSQLRGVPTRIQLVLYFEQPQLGQPRLVWTAIGPLLQPGEEQAALKGGTFQSFLTPEGWPRQVTFHLLNP